MRFSPLSRRMAVIGFGCIGCAPSPAQPPPTTQAPATPASNEPVTSSAAAASSRPALLDGGWATRPLRRLALNVRLPDAAGWKELGGSRWVRLQHVVSRSLLELSTSRERRLITPDECERRARLERPELPRPLEGEALDQRRMKLANDTFTNVTVSLEPVGAEEIIGHVTFFGASVGRCVVGHFSTHVTGPERDHEVARRLRLTVDGIVASLSPMAADDRVQAQPFER